MSGIKVYKVKDFIRNTETGNIDLKRSKQIARDLAKASRSRPNHNILVDLRETTVSPAESIDDIMEVVFEFESHVSPFKNKIANIVPGDPERMIIATRFKACMDIQGFEYEVFTDYESAIEWLSQTEDAD